MSTTELKEALHKKIDDTNEEWLLSNVLQMLNEEHSDAMSDENYAELMKRRESYLRGESKTYSLEEIKAITDKKLGLK